MADPVLKFPPDQKGNPPHEPRSTTPAEPRGLMTALRRHRRTLLLVVLPLAALLAGGIFYLNGGRYVTTDDAYVGAQKVLIHAGHFRQDRKGRWCAKASASMKATCCLRSIRYRSASPCSMPRPARTDPHHLRQSGGQHQNLPADDRPCAAGRRSEAARRRSQGDPGEEPFRLAARPRQCVERRCHRESAARISQAADSNSKTQLLGIPICRSNNFRPTRRPRRRSTRPSAISITP